MEFWSGLGRGALVAACILLAVACVLRLWKQLSPSAARGARSASEVPAGPAAAYLPHGRAEKWAHRALFAAWLCATGALVLLVGLFLADAFAFPYVAGRSNREMAVIYKVAALWAGQEGSLLLWLWIQSGYALVVSFKARRGGRLHGLAAGTLTGISAFFAVLTAFVANPFALSAAAPADGAGMNPILQSYWMMAHPVMLYLGYIGLSVPFAYGLGSLLAKSDAWIRATRVWSLVAWTFLSVGILFGARWAYEELGWGGYWAWDPVENASFMPWLVATAFIHSGLIQERRGMLKRWNHALILAAYLLTILGTFITRSGILSSVHAFVESEISAWFIGFIGSVIAAYLYALIRGWEELADERPIESPLSKESAFLANNVVFLATCFAIFWGTVFPLVASALGRQVTVGAPYFDRVSGPLFWLMIVLMGVGPLIAWRRASVDNFKRHFTAPLLNAGFMAIWLWVVGLRQTATLLTLPAVVFVATSIAMEFARGVSVRMRSRGESFWLALPRMMNRNPGRYGGYVVHLGVLFMVVGILASTVYRQETNVVLAVGEEARIGGLGVSLYDLRHEQHGAVPAVTASLLVRDLRSGGLSGAGEPIGFLRPSKRFYPGSEAMGPTTEVAVYGTWRGDLYAVLAGWEPFGGLVGFKLYFNPLVWLIWTGGALLVFGGAFSFWPRNVGARSEAEQALASLAELEYDYRMGKVKEEEYRELFTELSARAERYLQLEAEVAQSLLEEARRRRGRGRDGNGRSGRGGTGIPAALVVTVALLSALGQTAPASAQEAPQAPMAAGVAVPSETLVVRLNGRALSVLNFVHVTHVGDGGAATVRLPMPANAVLRSSSSPTLAPGEGGDLVDELPLQPGESRQYTLQYDVPVVRWPFAFQREIRYPTARIGLLAGERELQMSGLDIVPAGREEVAGEVFLAVHSEWIAPGTVWQVILRPTPAMAQASGWDARLETLPVIAEADRFPGDWLLRRLGGLPIGVKALVALAAAFVGGRWLLGRNRRRKAGAPGPAAQALPHNAGGDAPFGREAPEDRAAPEGRAAADDRDALIDSLARAVARLDIAYREGAFTQGGYRRRRKELMQRLEKLVKIEG